MTNSLKPNVYASAEERQRAMEDILIELTKFKVNGLHVHIPHVSEIMNIYQQSEEATPKGNKA